MRILVLLSLVTMLAVAQQPASNRETKVVTVPERPVPQQPPPITLQQALQIAEKYIVENKIDIQRHWLVEAKWILFGPVTGVKEPRWFFWWTNLEGSRGDYVEILVDMKGRAVRSPSM